MDDSEFESSQGQDIFLLLIRPQIVRGANGFSLNVYRIYLQWQICRGVKFTAELILLILKMSGAIPHLPIYAFITCTEADVHFKMIIIFTRGNK